MGRVFCMWTLSIFGKTGELDKEKLWHETPEETERHWQQFKQRLKDKGMWKDE